MTSTRTLPGLPRLVPVLTLGLLLAAAPRATAQRPTNPDSAQQAQMTSMMGPMMGQMMEAMDHSEVRELLEDAAIEPGGLERLMAGDTPTASIVAGHLAGCADCTEELERLRRSVGLIRPTIRLVPPAELKARSLAKISVA